MNIQDQIDNLQQQIEELKQNQFAQQSLQNDYINIQNITDFIESVSAVPTHIPRTLYEQIKLYKSGGIIKLYVYDYKTSVWHYATMI